MRRALIGITRHQLHPLLDILADSAQGSGRRIRMEWSTPVNSSASPTPPNVYTSLFHLSLHCTSQNTVKSCSIQLEHFPQCVLDLKNEIQRRLSIPICVQSLSFQSETLGDEAKLESLHIRSGDSLQLSYYCEGDCEKMGLVTDWIASLGEAVKQRSYDVVEDTLRFGLTMQYDEDLGLVLFDWLKPKATVNKLYFEQTGGLDTLVRLYFDLCSLSWSEMTWGLKYVECICAQSLCNFGETFALRRVLLKKGIFESCMDSLLRVRLVRGVAVVDPDCHHDDQSLHDHLLQRVIENALHVVCSLSELPECQVAIATRSDVLEQIVCMSLSSSYSCRTSVLVAEVFLCLGHNTDTHIYLARRSVVEGLLETCSIRWQQGEERDTKQHLLCVALTCFTCLALAQLILSTPHLIPVDLYERIRDMMESLVRNESPHDIRKYEEEQVCVWATLLPYLKLLFLPNAPRATPDNPLLAELQLRSVETVLFFLRSKIQRSDHQEILAREGLLDFVVCMPWHVSVGLRASAKAMVSELSSHVLLQPPRLSNIAKAMLAKDSLGLESVVKTNSVAEIIQCFAHAE